MSELGECYICTLDSAPLSPCNCKNMYLHYKCQINLIHNKGEKCSICLTEFNNVEVFTTVKYYYTWKAKTSIFILVLDVVMGGFGSYKILLYLTSQVNHVIIFIIGLIFLAESSIIGILISKAIIRLHETDDFYHIINQKIINLKT